MTGGDKKMTVPLQYFSCVTISYRIVMTAGFVVPSSDQPKSCSQHNDSRSLDHTFTMINTSCLHVPAGEKTGQLTGSPRPRWQRAALAAVAATVAATTGLLAAGGTASAQALPRNALAPQVVEMANEAIAALDQYVATHAQADLVEYRDDRTETARLAAQQLGYGEVDMIRAWNVTPLDHQRAVLAAMTQVGVPYRSHTSEEGVGLRLFRPHDLRLGPCRRRSCSARAATQINEAAPLDRDDRQGR